MIGTRTRGALISGALLILALAAPVRAFAVETSQITTPTGPLFEFVNESGKLQVKGTATGIATVDIRCYYGNAMFAARTVASEVPVKGEAFEAEANLAEVNPSLCQLRALPHEVFPKELGPGSESAEAKHFQGPLLIASLYRFFKQDYFASAATLAGAMFLESAGSFALESNLFSGIAHENVPLFFGDASFRAYPEPPAPAVRASLNVDGANAYVPEGASEVEGKIKAKGPLPGLPTVSVVKAFNEATRQFTITEEDPIVKCAPSSLYPPTLASCTSFASAGVTLVRTWQTTSESHLGLMSDQWRSTDGAEHSINARYYMEMHSGKEEAKEGGLYQFPGEAAFANTKTGETKTPPAGAGLILYKSSPLTPDGGDGINPQGAIAYDSAPNEPVEFTRGTTVGNEYNAFEMPYQRKVPAGGSSSTLRMAFAQGFALAEARTLAEGVLASYYPTVTITSPANGASIPAPPAVRVLQHVVTAANPTVTVSGTASDAVGLSSLTLNGTPVALGAGGAWSSPVTVHPGANTLTAVATNQSGLSSSASVTVSYTPPPAPANASMSGSPSGRNGKISLTLLCTGAAGQSCQVQLHGSVLERLRGRRVVSVSARTRSKRVTVVSASVKIPAGRRVKVQIGLNRTGRSLLSRFASLPVRLSGTLITPGAANEALFNVKITVKRPPKHRRH